MVADQASRLEAAAKEKSRVDEEAANLRAKLLRAEEKVTVNSTLNTTQDEAVAGQLSV